MIIAKETTRSPCVLTDERGTFRLYADRVSVQGSLNMIEIKKVLVPIDFSEFSDQALRYGQELCEKFEAELHLLHVLELHVTGAPQFTMGIALPEVKEESTEAAMKKLNDMPNGYWPENRKLVRKTAHGAPFVEIVRYAKEQDIDVIAMGTHGRTGLSHLFIGSIAENVVRQAPCPVSIVRKEGHQFVSP